MMDKAIEKIVQLVGDPLGVVAIILIFYVAKRLFSLEDWVRSVLTESLKSNTEAITRMVDHCHKRN